MNNVIASVTELLERAPHRRVELIGRARKSRQSRRGIGVVDQEVDDARIGDFVGAIGRVAMEHEHAWKLRSALPYERVMHAHGMHRQQGANHPVLGGIGLGVGQQARLADRENLRLDDVSIMSLQAMGSGQQGRNGGREDELGDFALTRGSALTAFAFHYDW